MRKVLPFLAIAIISLTSVPTTFADNHYKNFSVAVYIPVGVTRSMADPQWLSSHFNSLSSQLKIDKVYIETYRGRQTADENSIDAIKKFFLDHGVRVAGGLALIDSSPGGQFKSFDYADASDRQYVQHVVELTARHFDEIILDDFYFYSTKSDADIAAKGDRSWTQYRLDTMDDISRNVLMKPARQVNPHVKIIIKFPNWYEHFQGLGYDLDQEPKIFDGIYTGTETRDPVFTEQHLQAYESYSIMRYFENIAPGRNGGGWVDTYDVKYADRYAEQLWDTIFAKTREITLFNWAALERTCPPGERSMWQDQPTSFDYRLISTAQSEPGGRRAVPRDLQSEPGGRRAVPRDLQAEPTYANTAAYSLEQVDRVAGNLGNPVGLKSYRPPHATGEDFLHNYLGMIGIPIDLYPTFPADADMLLLTESAKADPDIVSKIKSQLVAGKSVIITSGLLQALQGKGIEDICEFRCPPRKAIVTDFQGPRGRPLPAGPFLPQSLSPGILIPQIDFLTNDAWSLVSGIATGNGYPILLMDHYSNGTLYVLTIPDNFADLYRFPPEVLSAIKRVMLKDFRAILEAPAQVSLFAYDNNTFVVESYLPSPTTVSLALSGNFTHLRNLITGQLIEGEVPPAPNRTTSSATQPSAAPARCSFAVELKPHSYEVFAAEK